MARAAFSITDSYNTITPESGPNKGKPFRVRSGTKVTVDPGIKATHQKGFGILPVFIADGTAEPKLTIDGVLEKEIRDIAEHVGKIGGYSWTWATVMSRPGQTTRTISAKGCRFSGGMGLNLEEGGASDKIDALCLDVEENGASIFHKRHP